MTSSSVIHHTTSILLLSCSLLAGCSSSSSDTHVQQQTYGQQLIDLKAAHDKGLITDREYEKSRKAVIDKMDD